MDTSPEYIKQCEKATEIQELWEAKPADFVSIKPGVEFVDAVLHFVNQGTVYTLESFLMRKMKPDYIKERHIWLPRQDQLQEMVNLHNGNYNLGLQELHQFVEINCKDETTWVFTSWEQAWLAFVMSERYSKKWNGEDWIDLPRM